MLSAENIFSRVEFLNSKFKIIPLPQDTHLGAAVGESSKQTSGNQSSSELFDYREAQQAVRLTLGWSVHESCGRRT